MDADIQKWRMEIERIDREIIDKLAARFKLTDLVMTKKKVLGLPVTDKKREMELLKKHLEQAALVGIDAAFVRALYRSIFEEAKQRGGGK
jgi:chorismate mutase